MPANDNHVDDIEWLMHFHTMSLSRPKTEDQDVRDHLIDTIPSAIRFEPGRTYFSDEARVHGRDIDLLERARRRATLREQNLVAATDSE